MHLENRGRAFSVSREPFTELRGPLIFNLRRDPYERAQHNCNTYNDWFLDSLTARSVGCSFVDSTAHAFDGEGA